MSIRCRYCNKEIRSIIDHRLTCIAEHSKWTAPRNYHGKHKLRDKYKTQGSVKVAHRAHNPKVSKFKSSPCDKNQLNTNRR